MSDQNGQEPGAEDIQPVPVPFGYHIASGRAPDGNKLIQFTLTLPTGRTVVYFPPEFGDKIARDLMAHTSGLEVARVVPGSSRFTPKAN